VYSLLIDSFKIAFSDSSLCLIIDSIT
jgi:hypothetical protein